MNFRKQKSSQLYAASNVVRCMSASIRRRVEWLLLMLFATHVAYADTSMLEQRRSATIKVANLSAACKAATPFYWEIGNRNGVLLGGSVGDKYRADSSMLIASAGKWIWAAYVMQLKHGQLSKEDISLLTMRSGYVHFHYPRCASITHRVENTTVAQCFTARSIFGRNDERNMKAVNRFYYNGGHFQRHAIELGLGDKNSLTLQFAMQEQLGDDVLFSFDSPQPAGGMVTTAAHYATFLRKILNGQLLMHDALGSYAVCTNSATCDTAMYAPIPRKENLHYSLGHWVEDDHVIGDGAFSSPGAFGFYPWIDRSKTYYGIVARKGGIGVAIDSINCGREIRGAWMANAVQRP